MSLDNTKQTKLNICIYISRNQHLGFSDNDIIIIISSSIIIII